METAVYRLTMFERWVVAVATIIFLVFGTLSAHWTRTFVAPDERPHFNYAKTIATTGRLPVLTTDPNTALSHQPPLAYLFFAGVYKLGEHKSLDTQVFIMRLWSLLISAGVVYLTARLAKRLFPWSRTVAPLAASLVALTPQFFYMSALVNNDGLTNLLGAAMLVLIVESILDGQISNRRQFIVAGLAAAAFLTKAVLWPLILVLLVVSGWPLRKTWRTMGAILAPVAVAAAAWFGRNLMLYGDPTGLNDVAAQNLAAQHRHFVNPAGLWRWFQTLVESAYVRFGYFNLALPARLNNLLVAGTMTGGFGLLFYFGRKWPEIERRHRLALLAVVGCVAVIFVGTFIYSLTFYQPQGRYMFPVMAGLAAFGAMTIEAFFPTKVRPLGVALLVLAFLCLDWRALDLLMRRG